MKPLILLVTLLLSGCHQTSAPDSSAIAHAGGGIDGKPYTNSIEALNHNYKKGFELFELDFSWTSDNHLVCLHDWDQTPKWLLDYHDEKPLSLKQFTALNNLDSNLTPCNMKSLND